MLAAFVLGEIAPDTAASARLELVSIAVQPQIAALIPGQTLTLRAIGTYADGSSAEITSKVSFRSSDPTIAKVEKNVATARSIGSVEISAISKAGQVPSGRNLALSVSRVADLSIDPRNDGIRLGSRVSWRALATLEDGTTRVNVTDHVDWSSSDGAVVQMSNKRKKKGIARARKLGTATIQATEPASGASATQDLTVVQELDGVVVSPSRRFVQVDDSSRFRAVGTFESDLQADISSGVKWESSDKRIAVVDKSGLAEGRALGTVEVRATDKKTRIRSSDASANATLVVVGPLLALEVDPVTHEMEVGDTKRFRALATFEGAGDPVSAGGSVDWFSSEPGVAAVEADGDVRCLAPGAATISTRDKQSGVTSTSTGGDGEITCL